MGSEEKSIAFTEEERNLIWIAVNMLQDTGMCRVVERLKSVSEVRADMDQMVTHWINESFDEWETCRTVKWKLRQ